MLALFMAVAFAFAGHAQRVYSSAKGEKYHTADCKLSGDADSMTLAATKKAGKPDAGYANRMIILKIRLPSAPGRRLMLPAASV
jgi:hypothetical protein